MSVSHHLTDETLLDYAAGGLSASMETLVACHLTVCHHCRARSTMAERIGGSVLDNLESVAVGRSAAQLLANDQASAAPSSAASQWDIMANGKAQPNNQTRWQNKEQDANNSLPVTGVPRPLARLLPHRLEELDWKRVAPGIKQHNLTDQHRRHGAFKLLHLAPGVVLSAHSHNDRELTYVVKGSYQDEIGRFKAGDIADLDGDVDHRPVVDTDEPCIALIATHSPVRFTGMFGKIMQPFVGL